MEKKSSFGMIAGVITISLFGLISIFFGMRIVQSLSMSLELHYKIIGIVIFISGIIYFLSSIFILRLKEWARKLTVRYSIILLLYTIPYILLYLVGGDIYFGGGGWGCLAAVTFSPYIIFPLIFIIFFTRPKVKEQFR